MFCLTSRLHNRVGHLEEPRLSWCTLCSAGLFALDVHTRTVLLNRVIVDCEKMVKIQRRVQTMRERWRWNVTLQYERAISNGLSGRAAVKKPLPRKTVRKGWGMEITQELDWKSVTGHQWWTCGLQFNQRCWRLWTDSDANTPVGHHQSWISLLRAGPQTYWSSVRSSWQRTEQEAETSKELWTSSTKAGELRILKLMTESFLRLQAVMKIKGGHNNKYYSV